MSDRSRERDKEFRDKRDFITANSADSQVLEEVPELRDYLFYHNVLDKFCWLLKFHYSDRETVKRRRHRIDTAFQWFVRDNFCSKRATRCLDPNVELDQIEYHLTKGWLNEAVRSDPLHPDYLDAGTMLTRWNGPGSGGLASWNLVQSYYGVYEYLCCLVMCLDHTVDTRGHRKVVRKFSSNLLGRANGRLVFYPFNMTSQTPNRGYIPRHPEYLKYQYANYPREAGRRIGDLEHEIERAFQLVRGSHRHSVFDFLYELRLWANYTGVQALLRLNDGGYQNFLMRNMAMVLFFVGGMAEFAAICALGEAPYLGMLGRFSQEYVNRHERFARNKFLVPFYIRLRAYKHLGIVTGPIDFIIPESGDPVRFIEV